MTVRGSKRSQHGLWTASALAFCAVLASQAAAQDATPESDDASAEIIDDIVVTGTSIRGIAPVGSPVVALDAEAIKQTSATTAVDVLRQLPQVFNLGADDSHFNSNQGASGNVVSGSGINLRGLGADATLTLLGGRRVPIGARLGSTQGSGGFDPSVIPTLAISRMEVMPDGGSAIYGSEAVGGVVNLILRKPFNGAEAFASFGLGNDFDRHSIGAVFGRTWGSGGFMIAAEQNGRSRLAAADRPIFTDNLALYGGTDQRAFNSRQGTLQVGTTRYALPAWNGAPPSAGQLVANTGNRQSAWEGADVLPEQQRRMVAMTFEQSLTDWLKFNAQGYYSEREAMRYEGASRLGVNLNVPRTNPFYVNPNAAASSVTVLYNLIGELGAGFRAAKVTSEFVTGDLTADLFGDWQATAFASVGRDRSLTWGTAFNSAALNAALADTNPVTAFNAFGGPNNPATIAKIVANQDLNNSFKIANYGISANGSLIELPGGSVKLAAGAEKIDIVYRAFGGNNSATANNTVYLPNFTEATRTVDSYFGELFIPIFGSGNAVPGFQELSVSVAGRIDRYSDVGTTRNPKLGVVWSPAQGVKFRGTYGTSFKAPAPAPDIATYNITLQNFTDPTSPTGTTRTLWVRGGSDNLTPETATTWSLGFDVRPAFLSGFDFSATYFSVDYRDRIIAPAAIVSQPLATAAIQASLADYITRNPSAALVQSFLTRPEYIGLPENPANVLAFIDGRPKNIGQLKTTGLEVTANYRFDGLNGTFRVGGSGTYVFKYQEQTTPRDRVIERVNTINYPLKFRARGTLGWENDAVSLNSFVNFANSYRNTLVTPNQSIDPWTTVDLSLRFRPSFMEGLTLSLDLDNALNAQPPIALNGNLPFDPEVSSAMGRVLQLGIRKTW